jgi:putative Holliday junction resolvase
VARWLGIDHGTRRLGLAVGDEQAAVASPLAQLSLGEERLFERILAAVEDYGAAGVVVGWPINADGTEGPQGVLARKFALELSGRTGLDVRLWDERLSSFLADQRLRGTMTRRQKKLRHDAVAAAAFLEDFLKNKGPATAPRPDEIDIGRRPKA